MEADIYTNGNDMLSELQERGFIQIGSQGAWELYFSVTYRNFAQVTHILDEENQPAYEVRYFDELVKWDVQ